MKYPKQKDQMSLIGSKCKISKKLKLEYFRNGKRLWIRKTIAPNYGKIVGFGCNYNGIYIPEDNGYFDVHEYYEPAHFEPTKRVVHIKVRVKGEGKSLKIHPLDCTLVIPPYYNKAHKEKNV